MMLYEVIESKAWVNPTKSFTVSIYGSPPSGPGWEIKTLGFTVRNNRENRVGIGRVPWTNREDAQKWVDNEHKRLMSLGHNVIL